MAVTNTLKYGTIVLAGFATITAWFYDSPWDKRWQVYMGDYVEIAEGVREREMIATAISGTNQFWLQIATNRSQMIALDSVITNLIPYFVDHTQIATWAANYPATNSPPHWTVESLLTYVLNTNRFPDYPLQVRKQDLEKRFLVLSNMVMTDSSAAWGSNQVYGVSDYGYLDNTLYESNNYFGIPKVACASNEVFWSTYVAPYEPTEWSNTLSGAFSVTAHAEDTLISEGFFQYAPGLYWNLYIYIDKLFIVENALWGNWAALGGASGYKTTYAHYSQAIGSAAASKTNSNIFGFTREIPIERIDWYYYNKLLQEAVDVPENTATSWTSFIEVSNLDGDSLLWNYSLTHASTNQNVSCTSDFLDYVDRNSYTNAVASDPGYYSATNVSASTSRYTSSVPMGVIHVWKVERCKPF